MGVGVGVGAGVTVGVGVAVGKGVGVGVGSGVLVGSGVGEGIGVSIGTRVAVGGTVGGTVAVGVGSPSQAVDARARTSARITKAIGADRTAVGRYLTWEPPYNSGSSATCRIRYDTSANPQVSMSILYLVDSLRHKCNDSTYRKVQDLMVLNANLIMVRLALFGLVEETEVTAETPEDYPPWQRLPLN